MNFQRDARFVNKNWMPTRGKGYPEDMEIHVVPMTIRERRLLENVSSAEYYRKLLDGIIINTSEPFRKIDLAIADAQFLDLARRIFTFEPDRKVTVSKYPCRHCGKTNVSLSFKFDEIELEDLPDDIFGRDKKLIDPETNEEVIRHLPGKEFSFADGMTVYVGPLTVGEYIDLAQRYISGQTQDDDSEAYIAQFAYLIKEIEGSEFKEDKDRRKFLFDYISNLYKPADEEVLDAIERETTSIMKPLITTCPDCGAEVEVYIQPWMRFQQEISD